MTTPRTNALNLSLQSEIAEESYCKMLTHARKLERELRQQTPDTMKNWKTTWTNALAAITALLTVLSLIPESLGTVIDIIPADWKGIVLASSAIATVSLRVLAGLVAKDANITNGPFPVLPRAIVIDERTGLPK